jgi:hypothetical protein
LALLEQIERYERTCRPADAAQVAWQRRRLKFLPDSELKRLAGWIDA